MNAEWENLNRTADAKGAKEAQRAQKNSESVLNTERDSRYFVGLRNGPARRMTLLSFAPFASSVWFGLSVFCSVWT